jgi:hypothetical protein
MDFNFNKKNLPDNAPNNGRVSNVPLIGGNGSNIAH